MVFENSPYLAGHQFDSHMYFASTVLEVSRQKMLPKRLLIQMDNCLHKNKNKYLGFLAYLVQLEVFSEVRKHY